MKRGLAVIGIIFCIFSQEAEARVEVGDNLSLYGDLRGRYEMDDRTVSGVDTERDRMRYRVRLGFQYAINNNVEIGARLATGSADANSPHVEMGDTSSTDNTSVSGFEKEEFMVDKAYVKATCKHNRAWAWFGKNSVPLWQQNEYFWDADVNPEGIALGYELKELGPLDLTLQGGTFVIKEGSWSAGDDKDVTLDLYQAVVRAPLDPVDVTLAYGVALTDGGALVRNNTSTTMKEDYSLASLQVKVNNLPVGVTLGYDRMNSGASSNEKGAVTSLKVAKDKWMLAALLIDIEANAVAPFAQDDFVSYYAGFEGTQLQLQYKIADNMDLNFRRFDGEKDNSTDKETRNRLDFNLKF